MPTSQFITAGRRSNLASAQVVAGWVVVVLLADAVWWEICLQLSNRIIFPWRDYILFTNFLDNNHLPSIFALYTALPEYEHRIVFPFYFYVIDFSYFSGNGTFLYFLVYLFNAAFLFTVVACAGQLWKTLGRLYVGLFTAGAACWFFAPFNWESLTFGVQACEMFALALMGVAFMAASAIGPGSAQNLKRDMGLATVAGALSFVATYSFGIGVVLCPVIVFYALLNRWRWGPLLLFGAFAAVTVGTYLYWYVNLSHFEVNTYHAPLSKSLSHPLPLIKFALNVLAWPPSQMFAGWVPDRIARLAWMALSFAVVLLVAARIGWTYFLSLRKGIATTRAFRQAAMQITAILLIVVLFAVTRVGSMSGWGRSSYAVASSVFWCASLALFLPSLPTRWSKLAIAGFAGASLLLIWAPARRYEIDITNRTQEIYQGASLATLGYDYVPGVPALGFGPDASLVRIWREPRASGPPYAARAPFKWMGRPLATTLPPPGDIRCPGVIASRAQAQGNARLSIVKGEFEASHRPHWLLLTDARGIVTGVGRPAPLGPDLAGKIGLNGQVKAGFEVVAKGSPDQPLILWGADAAGRLCRTGA